jgi:hypothetical protein
MNRSDQTPGKLSNPILASIYELEQVHEELLGYEIVSADIHFLSLSYPDDDDHQSLKNIAYEALALQHDAGIDVVKGLKSVALRTYFKRLNELSKLPSLSQKGQNQEEIIQERRRVQRAREIIEKRVPNHLTVEDLGDLGAIDAEPFITDKVVQNYRLVSEKLQSYNGKVVSEAALVESLFPDLYNSDRPESYRRFDEMYQSFKSIGKQLWGNLSNTYVQRGNIYQATAGGRKIEGRPEVIYRAVNHDKVKMLDRQNIIEQRVRIGGSPCVVIWDGIVPGIT